MKLRKWLLIAAFILLIPVMVGAQSPQVKIAWNAETPGTPLVTGYQIGWGTATGVYTNTLPVNGITTSTATLTNLTAQQYFVAISAFDAAGQYSSYSPELVIYQLNASAGSGGSISPSGIFFQGIGLSQTFTITPNSGYQIGSVTVDGASVGAVSSYTLGNIAAPHTISVTFTMPPLKTPGGFHQTN